MEKRTKIVILATLLFLLAVLVALGIDAAFTSLRVYRDMQAAKSSLFSAVDELRARNFEPASAYFAAAQERLDRARLELSEHNIGIGMASAIPFVSAQIEAMKNFVDIGSCLVQAGNHLCEIAIGFPGLDPNAHSESLSIGQMMDMMDQFQADLQPVDDYIAAARGISTMMDREWLISLAATAKRELDEKLDSAAQDVLNARELMAAFSCIMGQPGDAPNRYAVVLQDCYELRGSGGVMSTYGILECTHDSMEITECERAGTLQAGISTSLGIPQPLKDYYPNVDDVTLHFWDAGWWPDFPTTAALLNEILPANGKDGVRGYIAVDPIAIQSMLQELGPIELPEFNVTITSDNLLEKLLYYIEANPQTRPMQAQFLKSLAYTFFKRVTSASPQEWFELGKALGEALAEKHVLVYFNDPDLQRPFSRLDWSGQIKSSGNDYLMAVDSNIGGNSLGYKANLFVDERMNIELSHETGHLLRHRVRYYFDNTAGLTYYYSYLSLYVPLASIPSPGFVPESATEELGKRVFSKTIEVPPGERIAVEFDYLTPAYSALLVQKQPGQINLPLQYVLLGKGTESPTDLVLTNDVTLGVK